MQRTDIFQDQEIVEEEAIKVLMEKTFQDRDINPFLVCYVKNKSIEIY